MTGPNAPWPATDPDDLRARLAWLEAENARLWHLAMGLLDRVETLEAVEPSILAAKVLKRLADRPSLPPRPVGRDATYALDGFALIGGGKRHWNEL